MWVKERKPTTSKEAGCLAEDYLQAWKTAPTLGLEQSKKEDERPIGAECFRCGGVGHLARDCRRRSGNTATGSTAEAQAKSSALAQVRCYNCGQLGHLARMCPSNAMLCTEQKKCCFNCGRGEQSMFVEQQRRPHSTGRGMRHGMRREGARRAGVVEGQRVGDILLDTGASKLGARKEDSEG